MERNIVLLNANNNLHFILHFVVYGVSSYIIK
jgi:hypothetical protein